MYLRVANKGKTAPEALVTLGISTSKGKSNLVGNFGSGFSYSTALCLRHDVKICCYIDHLQVHFFKKEIEVNGQYFNKVYIKYGGKDENGKNCSKTHDTGFTTEFGETDWTNLKMALREFVTNAIDGAIVNGYTAEDVELELVEKPRVKDGYTQVFIEATPEVISFYHEVDKWFLHFAEDMLPIKVNTEKTFKVYKKGVLVSELQKASLFNYNVGEELRLDESRVAQSWDLGYAISQNLGACKDVTILEHLLKGVIKNPDCYEATLDYYYVKNYGTDESKVAWKQAWQNVYGKDAVACNNMNAIADYVRNKGFVPIKVNSTYLSIFDGFGIPTENKVLTGQEKKGRVEFPATTEMLQAVDQVWALLVSMNMINGKEKPEVIGFTEIMNGATQVFGEYDNNIVYLHKELGNKGLLKVTLEEIVHHITDSGDMSRDLQDFLFRLVIEIAF